MSGGGKPKRGGMSSMIKNELSQQEIEQLKNYSNEIASKLMELK